MSIKDLSKPGKIAIATDHGGFPLKQTLVEFLKQRKIEIVDFGTKDEQSVDYPDFAEKVAQAVSEGSVSAGILACGTGIGMCITANKFKKVRAAVVVDPYTAEMAKCHNNANIICLGGRVVDGAAAKKIVAAWLDAHFTGERHERRLDKIRAVEKKNFR